MSGSEIVYTPNRYGIDTGVYNLGLSGTLHADPVADAELNDLVGMATSDHWQDRIRAELLRDRLRITLPDRFPCLYERADSPHQTRFGLARIVPWVVSPDIDMLHAVLGDYQDLWDSYTSQWGPTARRVFEVGRLDGLRPHNVFRPGTPPDQVIATTLLTQSDMYDRAPQRLRAMSYRHRSYERTEAGDD